MAPRTTCKGQKDICRAAPGLPAGAVGMVAPSSCCGGPCTADACAAAWKRYQLAVLSAEATKHPTFPKYYTFVSLKSEKEMRAGRKPQGHARDQNIFATFFFSSNFFFFVNAKHGDIMFTSSMCCKIALVKHFVWQKCRGGDAEPRNVSPFLPHKMESSRTSGSLFILLY